MTSQRNTLTAFTDAAAAAVARAIADVQREARREREVRDAEHRARMAELDARMASVATLEKQVTDRLATLKDGDPGASVSIDDLMPTVTEAVTRAVAAIPTPKDGEPGRDANPDMIADMVNSKVKDAVASLPVPAPGRDADPELVRQMVNEAVAAIPPAPPGKDADPETVRSMVDEAISALPLPKDGTPGRDADMEAVSELVVAEVQRVLSTWEKPRDGDSVCADDLRPLIEDEVSRAVDALPKPKDGEPGKLPIVQPWIDAVHYAGDVRAHAGSTWQAIWDTAKEPPHADWICLARGGLDGRSFTIRGTWDGEATYQALDVVALNGAAFVAKRDEPGICPGDGWQLMSAQGKAGRPGDRGLPGGKGDRGEPGPPLVAAVANEEGVLTLTNGDGSTVSCDMYDLLARIR